MPHVKQGGRGNDSVATAGSKFEGIGLLNEQIGQTQLPVATGVDTAWIEDGRNGLAVRETGDDDDT